MRASRTFKLSLRQLWLPDSTSTTAMFSFLWSFFSHMVVFLPLIEQLIAASLRRDPPEIARPLVPLVSFLFPLFSSSAPLLVPRLHAYGVSLDGRTRAPGSVQIRSTWPPGLKTRLVSCKVATPAQEFKFLCSRGGGASLEGSKWFHHSSI